MKLKKVYVISGIVLLLIIIIMFILIKTTFSRSDNITTLELSNVISNKENKIIYIFNTYSNSKYTSKVFKTLDNNNIIYSVYDVGKVENIEYRELLKILEIDYDLFDTPALIYIKEGVMFANIININDMDIVDKFIEDYDLKVIK